MLSHEVTGHQVQPQVQMNGVVPPHWTSKAGPATGACHYPSVRIHARSTIGGSGSWTTKSLNTVLLRAAQA